MTLSYVPNRTFDNAVLERVTEWMSDPFNRQAVPSGNHEIYVFVMACMWKMDKCEVRAAFAEWLRRQDTKQPQ